MKDRLSLKKNRKKECNTLLLELQSSVIGNQIIDSRLLWVPIRELIIDLPIISLRCTPLKYISYLPSLSFTIFVSFFLFFVNENTLPKNVRYTQWMLHIKLKCRNVTVIWMFASYLHYYYTLLAIQVIEYCSSSTKFTK